MLPVDGLRRTLLEKRRRLFERVAHVEDDLQWLGLNVEPEAAEEGQEENMARLLARLDDRGRAEIVAIDEALKRIASGDYGHCQRCRKPISLERLRALPAAATCVACAGGSPPGPSSD